MAAAARKLGVNRSTFSRWVKQGAVPAPARGPRPSLPVTGSEQPSEVAAWGDAVRSLYTLNRTELELVTLAEAALELAHDVTQPASARVSAMGRFQALVKQLNFEVEDGEATKTHYPRFA
jgi:transposase-like protein